MHKSIDKRPLIPFLKWAGGKRWLTRTNPDLFPEKFEIYIEPFLGSGAVFTFLKPKLAILSDTNRELINTYKAIRDNHSLVTRYLREHHTQHSHDYYYAIRSSTPRSRFKQAAKFIYLNRTCWNGLYRVNLKGEFNVPIGTKTSVILDSDDFARTAQLLSNCTIQTSDFRMTISKAAKGDFLFVDPPYTVKHNNNGFIKYNESIFSWDDQVALSNLLRDASRRGVRFLMTNANHNSIRSLYREFDLEKLDRASVISGSSKFRTLTSELLIRNY